CFDEGEEIAHVVQRHALVGRIRERRIKVLAVATDTAEHGIDERDLAPAADAVLRIGRNVGCVERPESGLELKSATEPGLVLLAGRAVAGRAAPRVEHDLAIGEIGCSLRKRRWWQG